MLQQRGELLLGQARFADESAERALGEFTVIGNGQTPAAGMAQDHVAAGLMVEFVAQLAKGFDRVGAGANREAAHTETSTISSVIGEGTGSACFSRLWRYP